MIESSLFRFFESRERETKNVFEDSLKFGQRTDPSSDSPLTTRIDLSTRRSPIQMEILESSSASEWPHINVSTHAMISFDQRNSVWRKKPRVTISQNRSRSISMRWRLQMEISNCRHFNGSRRSMMVEQITSTLDESSWTIDRPWIVNEWMLDVSSRSNLSFTTSVRLYSCIQRAVRGCWFDDRRRSLHQEELQRHSIAIIDDSLEFIDRLKFLLMIVDRQWWRTDFSRSITLTIFERDLQGSHRTPHLFHWWIPGDRRIRDDQRSFQEESNNGVRIVFHSTFQERMIYCRNDVIDKHQSFEATVLCAVRALTCSLGEEQFTSAPASRRYWTSEVWPAWVAHIKAVNSQWSFRFVSFTSPSRFSRRNRTISRRFVFVAQRSHGYRG